jgi:hypothetical protein
MAHLDTWLAPFVMAGIGAACVWLALILLAEYRKAFMANPVSVISFDVLIAILRCGPPGYVAVIALFGGALLAGSGLIMLVVVLTSESSYRPLQHLWQALKLALSM